MMVRAAACLALLLLGPHGALAAKRPKPEPCLGGRFIVLDGAPLVPDGAPRFDAVAIDGTQVAIDSGCGPARVKLKATRKGTLVRARWAQCGTARAVKLQATIATPACDTMTGVRKAKKQKAVRFRAVRSVCGDGAVDAANGEACDRGAGCTAGQTCDDARCACVDPPATTTTSSTLAPATTTTSSPTTTTTTTLPAAVCGNGTVDVGEPCDLFAAPSGCNAGQQCDLAAGRCACTPIPDPIGKTVAFSLPPPPDPSTLPLPQTGEGVRYLNAGPTGMLTVPDAPADPLTAVARCTGWITACVSPPDRSLDDCARSAPHCTTEQPWLETERCCPSACFEAYETRRTAGASAMLAFRTTYFTDASCFPGVAALLGND